jgi:GNAT superfamily N-acetyltransferase
MIDVRELTERDFARASALPLHRFDGFTERGTYLVAWDGDEPVGHVFTAWRDTELGVPELQDMYVVPDRRNAGVGTALVAVAEGLARDRGHERCSLSTSATNGAAQRLYERLGYEAAGVERRVEGTIEVRGGTIEVDDTIVYFAKSLSILRPPVRRRA